MRSAWELWDGIDVWVNNAGADTLTGEAARWPNERKLAVHRASPDLVLFGAPA